ncbi:MAG: hypothetical protein ACREGL_04250 [Alphaproteobacteria bacterium]
MNRGANIALLAGAAMLAAFGPALADEVLNPVFAQMPEAGEDELRRQAGRGTVVEINLDAVLSGSPTITGDTGMNTIDGNAFQGAHVFASIVQNSGSQVVVENLMVLNVNMVEPTNGP